MIGLAGRPRCTFAVSAMCSCCSPPVDLDMHTDTQILSFTGGGGDPSMPLNREGRRLMCNRGILHRGQTWTEMNVFPSQRLVLTVAE